MPPPQPPPANDEARLMPVELRPDAREPIETAPGTSLPSMARRALDGAQPSVLRCYEELLVRHPTAAGRVEVQLDLAPNGAVTRAHLDHAGEGSIDAMLPCLQGVFSEVRVRDVDPDGQYVSRVYAFSNPPVERPLRTAVEITAPPRPTRPVRARGRRGAPTPPPPAPTPAPTTPPPGPGSLRVEEIARAFTDVPALRACAAIALRRARRPAGAATLRVTIGADGIVSEATFDGGPRTPPALTSCVVDAALALRLRASGIVHNVQVPITFRR